MAVLKFPDESESNHRRVPQLPGNLAGSPPNPRARTVEYSGGSRIGPPACSKFPCGSGPASDAIFLEETLPICRPLFVDVMGAANRRRRVQPGQPIVVFGGSVRAVMVRVLGGVDSGSGGGYEVKVLGRSEYGTWLAPPGAESSNTQRSDDRRVARGSQFGLLRTLGPLHYSLLPGSRVQFDSPGQQANSAAPEYALKSRPASQANFGHGADRLNGSDRMSANV